MDTRPKKICANCGGQFRVWETGRPPKCCGDYCRLQLWRKRRNQTNGGEETPSKEEVCGRRILAAKSTAAAARILVEEQGFEPDQAKFAAAIMRGEILGDVIDPRRT